MENKEKEYDLYVNGNPVITDISEKQVSWSPELVSTCSWYVVAKIMEGKEIIESFQSDEATIVSEPEAIDLGLPSGLKWASFNLGASKPEEYGDYFAWGETTPKDEYNWDTYAWCMGASNTITKYCTKSNYGYNRFTDGKTVLDQEDDAAHVNLGGNWRMPTDAE